MKFDIKKLAVAGVLTALGVMAPTFFHWAGLNSGMVFLPMHFPVLLCGLVCGWKYGGMSGIIVPLLCFALTGSPPAFLIAAGMAFELCAYGVISGLCVKKFNVYASLVAAMIAGRLVYSVFAGIFTGAFAGAEAFNALLVSLFVTSLPGIALQILILPSLAFALYKAKLADLPAHPFLAASGK